MEAAATEDAVAPCHGLGSRQRRWPRQYPVQPGEGGFNWLVLLAKPNASGAELTARLFQSDSDTDSDGDFETVGRARLKQQRATGRQQGHAPTSPQPPPQPSNGGGATPGAAQYVPASVELLGRDSWHAAAAEFGAAESALSSVSVVAADPPFADGEPCFSPNLLASVANLPTCAGPLRNGSEVRGAVVVVQRGVCTFLDKARRVQEAGGVGVLFVNSAETLFVPHGTDDDPGGDVWIPAVCMRKGDGEALLAEVVAGPEEGATMAKLEF